MKGKEIERRRNTRVAFETTVYVSRAGENASDDIIRSRNTRDVSMKGLYCVSNEVLPKDTRCHVEMVLSGTSSELRLHFTGKVVRTSQDGMGIEFEQMDPDSFFHLRNVLYYNTGDPERINREILGEDT